MNALWQWFKDCTPVMASAFTCLFIELGHDRMALSCASFVLGFQVQLLYRFWKSTPPEER